MAAKQVQVVITANATVANKVLKEMEQNAQRVLAKMNALAKTGKQNTREYKSLKKEFDAYNNAVRQNVPDMQRIDYVMEHLASTTTRDLRRALAAAKREMASMSANDKNLEATRYKMAAIQKQIDRNTKGITQMGQAWRNTLRSFLATVSFTAVLTTITSKVKQLVNLNLEFSDRLADIRKVSGLAMEDINNLSNRLAKIDTRTSIQELNQIAYAGAKLGMGNYGTEGLEGFVKAANQVNVALKEDLGADALTALSKITENMGLIKEMGIEDAMLKTGSAMFKLASTSTATANNIVEFSKRLTAMAGIAGITTDQLLALGSASDAMYLSPEVSATAFAKLISSLQTQHNLIEKELQITPGTINNLFSAGKAMDAIVLIFEKMHEKGNMNALGSIFKPLGSDGTRLVSVMTTMAKNVDMLKTHLDTSKEAFEEGTAVTAEYNIQQNTANGIMERANNIWMKAFVNPEGVDMVKEMAQAWYNLAQSLTNNSVYMTGIKIVMKELSLVISILLRMLPMLITWMFFSGVFAVLIRIVSGYKALVEVIKAATVAQRGLNLAQKASPIGFFLGAVFTLVGCILQLVAGTDKATESQHKFNSSMEDFNIEISKASHELDGYRSAIDNAKMGSGERAAAIKNFNEKFGPYLSNLLTEKSTMQDVAKAYEEAANAIQNKIAVQMQEKELETVVGPRIQWEGQWGTKFEKHTKRAKKGQYNYRWLTGYADDNKNRSMDVLASELGGKLGLNQTLIEEVKDAFFKGHTRLTTSQTNQYTGDLQELNDTDDIIKKRPKEYALLSGLYTIAQRRSVNYNTKEIKNKYSGYIKEIKPKKNDPGSLDNLAPDKDAAKAARKEARERKKAKQDDLKAAEVDSTAIISNIEEYYNLQEAAINDLVAKGKIDKHKMESMLTFMKKQRNVALQQARLAISGQDNTWDEFKTNKMGEGVDMANFSDQSQKSLAELRKIDTQKTYATLARFDGGKDADGVDSTAFLDSIRKKAAGNEREVSKVNADLRIKIIDMLQQYDAVAQVESDLAENLTMLGILAEDNSRAFKRLSIEAESGNEEVVTGLGSKQELEGVPQLPDQYLDEVVVTPQSNLSPFSKMFKQFIASGAKPYLADMNTTKGVEEWLKNFVSNYNLDEYGEPKQLADWTDAFPDIEKWLDNIPTYKKEIQAFYFSLLQAEDKYYEELKRQSDRTKKIFDSMWERSATKKSYDSNIEGSQRNADVDKIVSYKSPMQKLGLTDTVADDPEIALLQKRMDMEQERFEIMKQYTQDETLLSEQRKAVYDAEKAYAAKVVAEIDERINKLKEFMAPLEEFGSAAGEAFAKMSEDAESGKEALLNAVKSMVESYGKMAIKIIEEELMMRVRMSIIQKTHNEDMVKDEKKHGEDMADTQQDANSLFMGWVKKGFQKLLPQKKKQKKQEEKLEKDSQKEQTNIQKQGADDQQVLNDTLADGIVKAKGKMAEETAQLGQQQVQTSIDQGAEQAGAEVPLGIASGGAKTIGTLGWWGIPLVAVLTALLNGLLQFALSKIGKSSGAQAQAPKVNTKLTSGMLTYDSGNVQEFRGVDDGRSYPVVGSDGKVYAATDGGDLVTGLVKDPITTIINGQPALVAERGPEMVIGRETTAAMMMARPDIIREIVQFDRNRSGRTYRAYDNGNVQEVAGNMPSVGSDDAQVLTLLRELAPALTAFTAQIRQPLKASINKWGKGGLVDEVTSGQAFMKRYSQ